MELFNAPDGSGIPVLGKLLDEDIVKARKKNPDHESPLLYHMALVSFIADCCIGAVRRRSERAGGRTAGRRRTVCIYGLEGEDRGIMGKWGRDVTFSAWRP